ncbi:MAG TPA: DUF1080 domain-containing protein [Sumerlaeia bacterium]|nr:DUF1080 domain-containing protein [Sumerlaeia bacterium]
MMRMTEGLVAGLALTLALALAGASARGAEDGGKEPNGFAPIFDGKTLAGWTQKNGEAKYAVEDGAIVGTAVPNTPNSFLCTEKTYGDFILELEFKVDEGLNSGVQIRSNSLKDYNNYRVHGYQVEIDPSPRAYSAGIYDEARRGWLNDLSNNEPARKAFKAGDWNHLRIEAIGDRFRTWINDVPAADLVDSMTLEGFVGLQVHGIGANQDMAGKQVRWRNLRIKDLGKRTWERLFDGKTLTGWHTMPGGQWEVKDGVIVGTSAKSESRHGLLVTDKRYKDFTVRLKFRAVEGNSGLYFRVDPVEQAVGVNGFQAEIAPSGEIGGLYETGGRGWVVKPDPNLIEQRFRPEDWNEMTVSAHGRRIVVHLNGAKTAELKDDPGRTEGHIALQMHGGQDMRVKFKDVEILSAPAK